MRAALEVGRALWIHPAAAAPFRNVLALCREWLGEVAEQGEPLVARAQAVLSTIQLRTERLVHGDLQHHNILEHGRSWVAIDAQPAVGEPEYDAVTFLWNPVGTTPTKERTDRWMRAIGDAGLDVARAREWAIVRGAILSFSSEPGRRHETQLSVARSLL
jgi:streptomycin 6-kinase